MRLAWCWHCKAKVPMLDEEEFAFVHEAHFTGVRVVKLARQLDNRPITEADQARLRDEVAAQFSRFTGISDLGLREMIRHRLAVLGPPCAACGKELPKPRAVKCPGCGCERELTFCHGEAEQRPDEMEQ